MKKKKKDYLNKLFCNQADSIFACCPYPDVLIGCVKFNSLCYLNREITVKPGTTLIIGREDTPNTNLVMIANKCTFGLENDQTNSKEINIGDDTWICAGVEVKNGVNIGNRSIIALGAMVENSTLPDHICGGVPCKEIKKVDENYQSKNKFHIERTDEEIKKILTYLNTLGFNGDMTEYVKLLKGENYNCLDNFVNQVCNFTHDICAEYNSPNTNKEGKKL